jgi:fused signal recognition particle receptor
MKLSWWQRQRPEADVEFAGTAVADLVTRRKLDRAMLDDIEEVLRADLGTGRGAHRGCRRQQPL